MYNIYIVSIKGKNSKLTLNTILNLKVNIYDIKYLDNEILISISYKDYFKIKDIKTASSINILTIRGVKKFKLLIKKYKMTFIFFVCSIFFIVFLLNMYFFINININNNELKEIIMSELKNNNITIFSNKKNYVYLSRVSNIIKENNKELIEWIELKNDGVSLNVSVIERKNTTSITDSNITNIVANKPGLIISIYNADGEIIKNKGDFVNKGEVIISGAIKRNDSIVDVKNASGDVYAEVWYKVKISHPFGIYVQDNDIYGRTTISFSVLGKKYNILTIKRKVNVQRSVNIFNINITSQQDKVSYLKKVSFNELVSYLENISKEKIEGLLGDKEYIIKQKTLLKQSNSDNIYIEVFFKVCENISNEIPYVIEDD